MFKRINPVLALFCLLIFCITWIIILIRVNSAFLLFILVIVLVVTIIMFPKNNGTASFIEKERLIINAMQTYNIEYLRSNKYQYSKNNYGESEANTNFRLLANIISGDYTDEVELYISRFESRLESFKQRNSYLIEIYYIKKEMIKEFIDLHSRYRRLENDVLVSKKTTIGVRHKIIQIEFEVLDLLYDYASGKSPKGVLEDRVWIEPLYREMQADLLQYIEPYVVKVKI